MTAGSYGDDDRRPYFFLSYARSRFRPDDGTDADRWVTKLYKDLCHDVGIVTGTPNPGFMDRQIPAGIQWPEHLAEALACCRVFVALFSPAYFASEYCGKEWAAFVGRVKSQQAGLDRPLAIIPALWTRMGPREIPADLNSMQYIPPDFPASYPTEGFYGIMKLGRYREQYKQAVLQLARLIKETAEDADLATGPISDFEALGSAFSGYRLGNKGRRSIKLAVAAHRLGQLPADRDSYYYGRTMSEWAPYRGGHDGTPLAVYAEQVITDLGHESMVESVEDPPAEPAESPTVLLVDPWVTKDRAISESLRKIDEEPVNVLVPFNTEDQETVQAADDLSRCIDSVLSRGLVLPGSVKSIPSLEAFRAALPKAVGEAISRYLKAAPAHPPGVPPTMPKPNLQLPEK
jgi:FxsC-like protein